MAEEQKDRLDVQEKMPQEDVVPQEPTAVEADDGTSTEEPAKRRMTGWAVAVAVIAALLALCTLVVCLAAGIAAFSGGKDEAAAPAPTTAPMPTPAPGQAMIAITEPDQGQVVDVDQPVKVQGKGVALPEGNVVVEALDWQGNLLAQVPTTLQGRDVGTGGQGTWSTELTIEVEPGTAGRIRSYSTSPKRVIIVFILTSPWSVVNWSETGDRKDSTELPPGFLRKPCHRFPGDRSSCPWGRQSQAG